MTERRRPAAEAKEQFYVPSVDAPRPSAQFYAKAASKHRAKPTFFDALGGGLNLGPGESRVLLGLLVLGAVVRFWRLDRPSSVVFDEVHFGGFANKYIQSRFFMDVHPPLAKLLITLMAYISGFEGGSFDFKDIAREYGPDGVPYVPMRFLPATLGLLLIPLAYLTLRALKTRPTTAVLGALMIMFENGLITQSRFILLDSPLIFFTALTAFFWVGFSNENEVARDRTGKVGPFSRRWWVWLTLTGLALGAVVSCKWVGLFTIATIGILTIAQLWSLLGDLRVPMPLLARHFVARAICLIILPLAFYMGMFVIHFAVLSNSGDGDGFMSSEFQHTLQGHGMEDTFADVMIGSSVTIRHLNTQGGYLHSHAHNYPGGSKQQQITLYPHRDDNNVWLLLNSTINPDTPNPLTHTPPIPILDRSVIVLNHITTNKRLHSHDVRASVTEVDYQNEVTAYGFDGFEGDANDNFQVEIDQLTTDTSTSKLAKTQLQTLRTRFRLRHVLTGCYLFSHKVKLPDWGFEQQEVTCNKNPSKENGLWYIETNTHQALPLDSPKVNYRRPYFLAKFVELQSVMWQTNAGLTERHAYDSRPSTWPFMKRGINFWVKEHRQVYLIGNPFVWWTSTLAVLLYFGVQGLLILRGQRGYKDYTHSTVVYYDGVCGFLALGWFLHYFPFFLMSRQLFLHHYFPALYFAILLTACTFDFATSRLKSRHRLQALGLVLLATVCTYYYFSPLVYAGKWTKSQCEAAKWRKNWDFSCGDFYENVSDYHTLDSAAAAVSPSPSSSAATVLPVGGDGVEPDAAQTVVLAMGAAEPGQDAFQQPEEQAASHVPKSDGLPLPPPAPPVVPVPARDAETTTAALRAPKELAGALPAVLEGTAKEPESIASVGGSIVEKKVEAPRNAEEKSERVASQKEVKVAEPSKDAVSKTVEDDPDADVDE